VSDDADKPVLNKSLAECGIEERARHFLRLSQWARSNVPVDQSEIKSLTGPHSSRSRSNCGGGRKVAKYVYSALYHLLDDGARRLKRIGVPVRLS